MGFAPRRVGVAGAERQPDRAEGLDAALKPIAGQSFGTFALITIAVGVGCYGVFALFDAVYHRV